MNDIVMKAAREIGLGQHVSVAPFDGRDPLVTVSFPPKAVQGRIPATYLVEERLEQVKTILGGMARSAMNN